MNVYLTLGEFLVKDFLLIQLKWLVDQLPLNYVEKLRYQILPPNSFLHLTPPPFLIRSLMNLLLKMLRIYMPFLFAEDMLKIMLFLP